MKKKPDQSPITQSGEDQKNQREEVEKLLASRVSHFKTFFHHKEIEKKQGFSPKTSESNLANLKNNLCRGFDYIKVHATDINDIFSQEQDLYKNISKLGLTKEEATLFELITQNLTLQHASPLPLTFGESLNSIRERENRSEIVDNKRTSEKLGRQNFVYFVMGIGHHINTHGLDDLNVFHIDLNKFALHNPNQFKQIYISPHLTEFHENAFSNPVILGGTRIDMRFDQKDQIIYRIKRPDGCILEKIYHHHDFVFFGGEHVIRGTALRFIELLRLIGNPYRAHFLASINNLNASNEKKIAQLSEVMTALMPGWMVLEAKIPQTVTLNEAYTNIIQAPENESDENDSDIRQSTLARQLEKHLVDFLKFQGYAGEVTPEITEMLTENINDMLAEHSYPSFGMNDNKRKRLTNYIPRDLILLFQNLISSNGDLAPALFEWLLSAPISSPIDSELKYVLNINQRKATNTPDLFEILMTTDQNKEQLEIYGRSLIAQMDPKKFARNFTEYVLFADKAPKKYDNLTIFWYDFLFSLKIPLEEKDPNLLKWMEVPFNQPLLEYMFEQQQLDINAVVHRFSWLEHAILAGNAEAAEWLLQHGAKFHRQHEEVMANMSDYWKEKLGIDDNDAAQYQQQKNVNKQDNAYQDAVVIIVTSRYYGELCTTMGRRRLTQEQRLENQWSFPGGLIDEGETPLDAAYRELEEETGIAIDKEKAKVEEIVRFDLSPMHKKVRKINQMIFVHIDLGKELLPGTWPNSDLGAVSKIELNQEFINQSSLSHKQLPLRHSNANIFSYLIQKKPIDLQMMSDLLFVEAHPYDYVCENLNTISHLERDHPHYLVMIERIINNLNKTLLHDIDKTTKQAIFYKAVQFGDPDLTNCLMNIVPAVELKHENAVCPIYALIMQKNWPMLTFLKDNIPELLLMSSSDWKKWSEETIHLPDTIRITFEEINSHHQIMNTLINLCVDHTSITNRDELCQQIIEKIEANPNLLQRFEKPHLQLIMLTGHVPLMERVLSSPRCKNILLESSSFMFILEYIENVDITNILGFLIENEHTDMLQLLEKEFPLAYELSIPSPSYRY